MTAQPLDACDRDGAVGGDVLPAIGERRGEEGGTLGVPEIGAGLEQIGLAAAAIGDPEVVAAARVIRIMEASELIAAVTILLHVTR
jgi:hypothetical protein